MIHYYWFNNILYCYLRLLDQKSPDMNTSDFEDPAMQSKLKVSNDLRLLILFWYKYVRDWDFKPRHKI